MSSTGNNRTKVIVGYHGYCMDGLGSLAVVAKKYGKDNVIPVSLVYARSTQGISFLKRQIDYNNAVLKEVAILDFCFDYEHLVELYEHCSHYGIKLTIADHHASRKEGVDKFRDYLSKKLDNDTTVVFDITKCGTMLSWDVHFPETKYPPIIEYINDRDLWVWAQPNSRRVSNSLKHLTGQKDYLPVLDLLDKDMEYIDELQKKDPGLINEYIDKTVGHIGKGTYNVVTVDVNGKTITVLVKPIDLVFSSDAGEKLYNLHPEIDVVLMYSGVSENVGCSLRSSNNGLSEKLAAHLGGGGHPDAAGCKVDRETFVKTFLR